MIRRHLAGSLPALAALVSTSCAVGPAGGAGRAAVVYVLSARDATIARLDAATGRELGPRLPAGAGPGALAVGGGAAVVQPASWRDAGGLTHVARTENGWAAEPLAVDPAGRSLALAGDGERFAVLAYTHRAGAPRCRLALIDVRDGSVVRSSPVGAAGDAVVGLALATTGAGPIAFLVLWRPPGLAGAGRDGDRGGGRVLAVAAATGTELASYALAGVPGEAVVAPVPGESGEPEVRLYVVEGLGGETADPARGPDVAAADRWRVLALRPLALDLERTYPAPVPPRALAVAPEGRHAYAFAGRGHPVLPSTVVTLDLATGAWRDLARGPGSGAGGLAVAAGRLYVPHLEADRVTAFDQRTGALLGALDAGRAPAALAVGRWVP